MTRIVVDDQGRAAGSHGQSRNRAIVDAEPAPEGERDSHEPAEDRPDRATVSDDGYPFTGMGGEDLGDTGQRTLLQFLNPFAMRRTGADAVLAPGGVFLGPARLDLGDSQALPDAKMELPQQRRGLHRQAPRFGEWSRGLYGSFQVAGVDRADRFLGQAQRQAA